MITPSARRRAEHRRSLFLLVLGLTLAVLCWLVQPHPLGGRPAEAETSSTAAAPAEPALRPNAPTEPLLGVRLIRPGDED